MGDTDPKSLALMTVSQECRERIGRLNPDAAPRWGKMTAAQMMAHCSEVLEVAAGKAIQGTPWFIRIIKPVIRKMVVGPKPYPRGTRTHPQYLQVAEKDFGVERVRLLTAVDTFTESCAGRDGISHPFFGEMTVDEAGRAMYKHLDHHLEQFGV